MLSLQLLLLRRLVLAAPTNVNVASRVLLVIVSLSQVSCELLKVAVSFRALVRLILLASRL